MAGKIRIVCGDVEMTATLNDSATAAALLKVLPVDSTAQRWGDEVYFDVPLEAPAEDARAKVPSGTIAYWPDGPALCIFFGQTPYSPVNVVGKVDGDENEFSQVGAGDRIRIEKV
ncbi:MAG TPA: cyclophilin-like fold protein [Planctomycetota bacterium]|nr:cyclophilin-like fold protein [Planctomycetota bacterium]